MIEISETPTTVQMEGSFQTVKSVTGKDEANEKRVLDEMEDDTIRAEASQPDNFRNGMTLTGVDEATVKNVLEESSGDMTTAITKQLDNLENDEGAPVVNQVFQQFLQQSQISVSGQQLP